MNIEVCTEPVAMAVPDVTTVYMSLVRYPQNIWIAGPTSTDFTEVCRLLRSYKTITAARVYSVTVPCEPTVPQS